MAFEILLCQICRCLQQLWYRKAFRTVRVASGALHGPTVCSKSRDLLQRDDREDYLTSLEGDSLLLQKRKWVYDTRFIEITWV